MKRSIVAGAVIGAGLLVRSAVRTRLTFQGKTVLITGGSRGLGLEIARLFAAEGANVCLVARTASSLERAQMELEQTGARILPLVCDIRLRHQVDETIQKATSHFGSIDVLVNNAGVIEVGPSNHMGLEDYQKAMDTHAWGSLYTMLAVLPHMKQQESGRIVNISSIGGKIGVPHLVPYCMSKFALAGLSEALGNELAQQNILVTTVFPGLMRTGSHANASFKGQHRSEFAWFSVAAASPALTISSGRAARQIVEACRLGKAEVVIAPQARVACIARNLLPGIFYKITRTTAAFLPKPGKESETASYSGWASWSRWSPSLLTRLADRMIPRNNEIIGRSELPSNSVR